MAGPLVCFLLRLSVTAAAPASISAGTAATSAAGTSSTSTTRTAAATRTTSTAGAAAPAVATPSAIPTTSGNSARSSSSRCDLGNRGAELVGDLDADAVERQDNHGGGHARQQGVLNEVLAVSAVNQRAGKLRQSLGEGCPGHG